jgi:LmbE family N-acetylglucosaminyl deacetylase
MTAAMLGLRNVDFEFPDFELRMREPEERFLVCEEELEKLLKIELYRLIAETKPEEIFAPAAVGNHPDHRMVFNIILDFFDAGYFPDTRFHLYEDVPYSASYYEIDDFLARFETSYITVLSWLEEISPVLRLKNALCAVYRSQASSQLLDTIDNIAKRTAEFLDSEQEATAGASAAERFWTLEESPLLVD